MEISDPTIGVSSSYLQELGGNVQALQKTDAQYTPTKDIDACQLLGVKLPGFWPD